MVRKSKCAGRVDGRKTTGHVLIEHKRVGRAHDGVNPDLVPADSRGLLKEVEDLFQNLQADHGYMPPHLT